MVDLSRPFLNKVLVAMAFVLILTSSVHHVDDWINVYTDEPWLPYVIIFHAVVLSTVFIASLWVWADKVYGHVILGLIAIVALQDQFLAHVFGVDHHQSFAEIAGGHPESWVPIFLLVLFLSGIASIVIITISGYQVLTALLDYFDVEVPSISRRWTDDS